MRHLFTRGRVLTVVITLSLVGFGYYITRGSTNYHVGESISMLLDREYTTQVANLDGIDDLETNDYCWLGHALHVEVIGFDGPDVLVEIRRNYRSAFPHEVSCPNGTRTFFNVINVAYWKYTFEKIERTLETRRSPEGIAKQEAETAAELEETRKRVHQALNTAQKE